MGALRELHNLRPASERWLEQVGIHDETQLRALGAVAAYRKVRAAGFKPSLNLLYAIAGALLVAPWHRLPPGERERLLFELDGLEQDPALLDNAPLSPRS